MYYGVEQSTDMRCKNTIIKKFTSEKVALSWRNSSLNGRTTYADPVSAQNWHHTFRRVYEHFGRVDKSHEAFKERGTSTYPCNDNDRMENYLFAVGIELPE